ncbi:hypothetical protein JOC70_002241 [Clostridium pascui]|uniref:hypothetical protein n=1 Tax=Clostridium pascui TaxID=46609 RepID=UPI00195797EB|nr:hypothetical protein [Clostridium pascui]MBM7870747.1 hypothetical protein [Clostridium pascui]
MEEKLWEKLEALEKSDKTLKEVLPQGSENMIKVYIFNNRENIIRFLKGIVNNPNFKKKISEEIVKFTSNMNPMMAKFINVDSMQTKVVEGINGYLQDENNVYKIVELINEGIDKFKDKRAAEVLMYIPYEGKKELVRWVCKIVK